MKWNKEIINNRKSIYSVVYARSEFKAGNFKHRKLSLMKQENIRIAGRKKETKLTKLKLVAIALCGYCFKYWSPKCDCCPIAKKIGKPCHELKSYFDIKIAKNKAEFLKHHKIWCKEIGLWQKNWR